MPSGFKFYSYFPFQIRLKVSKGSLMEHGSQPQWCGQGVEETDSTSHETIKMPVVSFTNFSSSGVAS